MLWRIPPLLAYKAGSSLETISVSYSAGFIANYLVCYWVCGSMLKQYRFALLVLLINLLFAAHTFYWPISQVPQGMAMMMVVWAMIWEKRLEAIKPLMWCSIACLLVVLVFFHPLMLVALAYSIVFFLLSKDAQVDRRVLYRIGAFFVLILVLKSIFFRTQYERHSLSGLKNFIKLFPYYFNTFSNKQFIANCVSRYYWIPVLFAGICALYLRTGNYKKLLFFGGAVAGYLMLVNIMYPTADTPLFYIENLYLPVSLFIGLPLVFDLLPVLEQRSAGGAVMALIMITGCVRLYAAHNVYSERLQWQRSYLAANGDKKIIADSKKANAGILPMLWGTPYEFWQLSTIEQGRSASIIIDEDPPHRDWARDKRRAFVVNWNVFDYSELDPKYFRFTDTTTGYIIEEPVR